MLRTAKFTLVEVVIAATVTAPNSRIYIGNQPQLQTIDSQQTIFIKALETYSNEQLTKSPLTTLANVATPAAIKNATLTIVVKGTEELQFIPLADMVRNIAGNGTAPAVWQPFLLDNLYNIDWSKSFIQVNEAPAATPFSYLIGVHYDTKAEVATKNYYQ